MLYVKNVTDMKLIKTFNTKNSRQFKKRFTMKEKKFIGTWFAASNSVHDLFSHCLHKNAIETEVFENAPIFNNELHKTGAM